MKKGILLIFWVVALLSISSDAFAYSYLVYNYRNRPVRVKIITTLIGAPKPTAKIASARRVEKQKVEYTRDGKKVVKFFVIEPSRRTLKIGGILYGGACLKDFVVDGESKGGRDVCGDVSFVLGSGGKIKRYLGAWGGDRSLSPQFKYGDWPAPKSNQDPRIVKR